MTEPTLQGQSDYLAEHLLGWERISGFDTGRGLLGPSWQKDRSIFGITSTQLAWHPHSDISQCFEYIVPALDAYHDLVSLSQERRGSMDLPRWRASVCGYSSVSKTASEAIVRAAYLAVKAVKEKE